MPCQSDPDDSYVYEQLEAATKAACEALRCVSRNGLMMAMSSQTKAWHDRHEEDDRLRIEAEQQEERRQQLRKYALEKLTDEERIALNLGTKEKGR